MATKPDTVESLIGAVIVTKSGPSGESDSAVEPIIMRASIMGPTFQH